MSRSTYLPSWAAVLLLVILSGCGDKELPTVVSIAFDDRGAISPYYPRETEKVDEQINSVRQADKYLSSYIRKKVIDGTKIKWSPTIEYKDFFYKTNEDGDPFVIVYCFKGKSEVRYFVPD